MDAIFSLHNRQIALPAPSTNANPSVQSGWKLRSLSSGFFLFNILISARGGLAIGHTGHIFGWPRTVIKNEIKSNLSQPEVVCYDRAPPPVSRRTGVCYAPPPTDGRRTGVCYAPPPPSVVGPGCVTRSPLPPAVGRRTVVCDSPVQPWLVHTSTLA